MRYRRMDADGDYVLGLTGQFLVNTPQAVVQAITTRLAMHTGEWFLDLDAGTPFDEEILGMGTAGTRDNAIRERVLGTPGVKEITAYTSRLVDRKLTVTMTVSLMSGYVALEVVVAEDNTVGVRLLEDGSSRFMESGAVRTLES